MRAIHKIEFPAKVDDVEFSEDERAAIIVSRAMTTRDLFVRYGASHALIHHEEDRAIIVAALEAYIEKWLRSPRTPQESGVGQGAEPQ